MIAHRSSLLSLVLTCAYLGWVSAADNDTVPAYVKQCRRADPELVTCLKGAINHLRPYLATGIPEIEMPSIEPFRADQLTLSLSSGPRGYKIVLKDLDIFGISNFTVNKIKLGSGSTPFEARLKIPHLHVTARYTSSGVLIILPATGQGSFFADLSDVDVMVRGVGVWQDRKGEEYLQVNDLVVDLNIQKVVMHVKKIFNNNRILTEATNLFLRENGQEVLRHMMPQLRRKISSLFAEVANTLLKNVPVRVFLI